MKLPGVDPNDPSVREVLASLQSEEVRISCVPFQCILICSKVNKNVTDILIFLQHLKSREDKPAEKEEDKTREP
mgnify:CR=1 FL=1